MNRRELLSLASVGSVAWKTLLAPVKAIAADVKPVRIRTVENFTIQIPAAATQVEAGFVNRLGVMRVVTESGVRGYSFTSPGGGGRGRGRGSASPDSSNAGAMTRVGGPGGLPIPNPVSFAQLRDTLIGSDLFALEQHLQRGLLYHGPVEEALWDAIGKIAGQPVFSLLAVRKPVSPFT